MIVFADNLIQNYGISRIEAALKKYVPEGIEFTDHEKSADLVIIYAYGQRRKVAKRIKWILERGQKYAMLQIAIRSTTNPQTRDWEPFWQKAEIVWSYYDLIALMNEDDSATKLNFYYAPLGVEERIFRQIALRRSYKIAVGDNRDESINECIRAAKGKVFHLGTGLTDRELALGYSGSKFVSGLRRKEGFEMPVLEGLLCGARPICYDKPHYKHWFGDLAEYIPEGSHEEVVQNLSEIFSKSPRTVTGEEKELVKTKFNWQPIIEGFWGKL